MPDSSAPTPSPFWDENEDLRFLPWKEESKWEPIAWTQAPEGRREFVCADGKGYHISKEGDESPKTEFETLAVRWPNKTGRAEFGYVVRRVASQEVVAVIHQDFGWTWCFKLKFPPEEIFRHRHENGWFTENLLANTLNSVMSRLV